MLEQFVGDTEELGFRRHLPTREKLDDALVLRRSNGGRVRGESIPNPGINPRVSRHRRSNRQNDREADREQPCGDHEPAREMGSRVWKSAVEGNDDGAGDDVGEVKAIGETE